PSHSSDLPITKLAPTLITPCRVTLGDISSLADIKKLQLTGRHGHAAEEDAPHGHQVVVRGESHPAYLRAAERDGHEHGVTLVHILEVGAAPDGAWPALGWLWCRGGDGYVRRAGCDCCDLYLGQRITRSRNYTARAGGCGRCTARVGCCVMNGQDSSRRDRFHRAMTMSQELTVQDSECGCRDEKEGRDSPQDNRDHSPFLEETLAISEDVLADHQGWFAVGALVVDLPALRRRGCLELDVLEILHLD
ncbi:hypothetical protein F5883DRAFT_659116, partial [Diaporthe sp. PMI_573]